jgi:hypothetical protein
MIDTIYRLTYSSNFLIHLGKTLHISLIFIFSLTFLQCDTTNSPPEENESSLFSDNFDGENLSTNWHWSNEPDEWDLGITQQGWLSITGNFNSNLWCLDETSTLYQIVKDDIDFDISTRMSCEWGNNLSDIAGIIIKFPSVDNWINIKLWMQGNGTGRLEFQKKCDDLISPVPGYGASGGSEDVFLRIVKISNEYTGYYKTSSEHEWIIIGTTEGFGSLPIHIGLFGGVDQGEGDLSIRFDYFHK